MCDYLNTVFRIKNIRTKYVNFFQRLLVIGIIWRIWEIVSWKKAFVDGKRTNFSELYEVGDIALKRDMVSNKMTILRTTESAMMRAVCAVGCPLFPFYF